MHMNPEELRVMVVEELDLKGMTPEQQDQIIDQFTENTLKRVALALFERLPQEARPEFARLSDAGDSESVTKLFQKHIPDMDALIRAEVKDEVDAFKKFQSAS
jgi:hypothetical protein